MSYALVAINYPVAMSIPDKTSWENFLETLAAKISTYENTVQLSQVLLQFSLEKSLHEFLEVQTTCKQASYSTIISFFDKKPNWITS